MENLHILKIILKDSPNTKNKFNIDLFDFLNLNFEEIIEANYYIQPILVDNTNIDILVKKGISNTPALLDEVNNETINGVSNIIQYIVSKCEKWEEREAQSENKSKTSQKQNVESLANNESDIRNYLLNEALTEDTLETPVDVNKVKSYEDKYKKNKEKLLSKNTNANKTLINAVKKNINNPNRSVENYSNYNGEEGAMIKSNNEITHTKKISEYMDDDPDLKKFWENLEVSDT
jgi:hypothetical protein